MKPLIISLFIIIAIVLTLNYTTKHPGKERILKLVNSPGACDRIKGFIAIGYSKDTSLYHLFFINMKDRNIAHCLRFYGKSVLWGKIEVLKRITKIDFKLPYDPMNPNPQILEFYKTVIYKMRPQ